MCGFQIRDIDESFGGHFLAIEAAAPAENAFPDGDSVSRNTSTTEELGQALDAMFSGRVVNWEAQLGRLQEKRKRVVAWGAGAKATTFLNIVDPSGSLISHVIDINPRKAGRFVPGSGHEIVAPNTLKELRPDVIILMNEIYRDEIAADTAALGLNPTFLAA
jgi:hypothetical protein